MSFERRLINEIKRDWSNDSNNGIYLCPQGDPLNHVTFIIFFEERKTYCYVTINFENSTYPFKQPDVYIKNKNYKSLLNLSDKWVKLFKIFKQSDKPKCLCCSSILCNWYAGYTMKHILDEIKKNLTYRLRRRDIIICKSFVRQKFGHYIPIQEYL